MVLKKSSWDYNYEIAGFTGYTPGNTWETQPGFVSRGCPLWNGAIPYWIVANGQRLVVVANIESNYVSFHMGFMLPFATPGQYPYPLLIGGCLSSSQPATRYSSTSYNNWWKGYKWQNGTSGSNTSYSTNLLRSIAGSWGNYEVTAYHLLASGVQRLTRNTIHDSGIQVGYYGLRPLTLATIGGTPYYYPYIYGDIDGLYHISGFNNVTENTIVVDGITYIVFRDVWRTQFHDYMALKAT